LMELCSKIANQRGPLEDCAPVLSELVEAHRSITNELQDMYPAYRFDVVYRMDAEDVEPIIALGDLDRLSLKSSLGRHQEATKLRGTQ
jgi:hypothetical protein